MEYTERGIKEELFGIIYGTDEEEGFDFEIDLSPPQVIEFIEFVFQRLPILKSVPDMYEALKALIRRDDCGSIRLPSQARDIMVKALAKAEEK